MGKKLYVGNLSYTVNNAELEGLFAAFGTVQSAEVVEDRDTGRGKGFGFVEMGSDEEAAAAIAGLSGQEHEGRALTVNEARPREERGGGVAAVAVVVAAAVTAVVAAAAVAEAATAAVAAADAVVATKVFDRLSVTFRLRWVR